MLQNDGDMGIGALSHSTGVKVETVRYYEKIGLLPAPRRSAGGHRIYNDAQRRQLGFIRRARELGFSIDRVRALLGLSDGDSCCEQVKAIALDHLADVRQKISDLQSMERTLSETASRCEEGVSACPIVASFYG